MDTKYFDKQNIRLKAESVDEKNLFGLYYDSSFDNTKHWILYFLYPLLKKYSTM